MDQIKSVFQHNFMYKTKGTITFRGEGKLVFGEHHIWTALEI